jgi:translation initiation factor 1
VTDAKGRVVYASGKGRVCPGCGWPSADCRCAAALRAGAEPVPAAVSAGLRLENRASGKAVTRVEGLPDNRPYLDDLCRALKKACGTGGTVQAGGIELQGDQRERLRELLPKKGIAVKG